jgi:metallo-beta-lactamase family protein
MTLPTLTCHGAAGTVTGSRHLLEACGKRILIDCGLFQERDLQQRNWDAFDPPAEAIDAVVLTHAHVDHCGLLPRLVKAGFSGPVHATSATCAIAPVILADAARLQAEDAAYKAKRHAREGRISRFGYEPLYDERDVAAAVGLLQPAATGTPVRIAPDITATFIHAGHILGSASVLFTCGHGADTRRVLFSGDLGRHNRPILPDPAVPLQADLVVVESTYGDRSHGPAADVEGALHAAIDPVVRRGGVVVIPAFAVERAQELLWHLARLMRAKRLPAMPVVLDSPMAQKLLAVYRTHSEATEPGFDASSLDVPGLLLTQGPADSKEINDRAGPMVIIAGSGMCTGGRIKHHLAHRIEDARNLILFVGYQADGTLGRQILDGKPWVRLFGVDRQVRAQVARVSGFSGHADRDEILAWLGSMPHRPRQVVVVHGTPPVAAAFAALVHQRLGSEAVAARAGVAIPVQ